MSSLTDSRVILDQAGAERLVGQGDMLLLDPKSSSPNRIQGAWVTRTRSRASSLPGASKPSWFRRRKNDRTAVTAESITESQASASSAGLPGGSTGDEEDDDLLMKAIELVVDSQLGSTSMLQRKLRVGFARAGRLMDSARRAGHRRAVRRVQGPRSAADARRARGPQSRRLAWPLAPATTTSP